MHCFDIFSADDFIAGRKCGNQSLARQAVDFERGCAFFRDQLHRARVEYLPAVRARAIQTMAQISRRRAVQAAEFVEMYALAKFGELKVRLQSSRQSGLADDYDAEQLFAIFFELIEPFQAKQSAGFEKMPLVDDENNDAPVALRLFQCP